VQGGTGGGKKKIFFYPPVLNPETACDDIEFVTEFPCFLWHPVHYIDIPAALRQISFIILDEKWNKTNFFFENLCRYWNFRENAPNFDKFQSSLSRKFHEFCLSISRKFYEFWLTKVSLESQPSMQSWKFLIHNGTPCIFV